MWVLGPIGIDGNEIANKQAKIARTNSKIKIIPGPSSNDIKMHMNDITNNKRLNTWKQQTIKLNTIQNNNIRWINNSLKRQEESILNRLRIGHTRLMHGYLIVNGKGSLMRLKS